jgi:DNA-binding XRE family transcriptional regulator
VEEQYISHLKKYRQLAELTQEELAEKAGVRRETIVRLEAAKYNPSLKLAVDISRIVGAPIEEIFVFPVEAAVQEGEIVARVSSAVLL